MFCEKCGAEVAENSAFCEKCGAPVQVVAPQQNPAVNTMNAGVKKSETIEKIKALPMKVKIGVVAALVVVIAAICVYVKVSSTINLNKYVTVEFEGYDGYGTAYISIDWEAIEDKYGDKVKLTSKAKKELKNWGMSADDYPAVEALNDSISVYLDKTTGLSNGDKVKYKWSIDDELFDYVKCDIKYSNESVTVEDLEEVGTFDAFANLEVTFTGTAPNGSISLEYTGDEMSTGNFTYENGSNLSNGDEVTISISSDVAENLASTIGKVPAESEKTYTVEGLSEYITSLDGLTGDYLNALMTASEDAINSYAESDYDDGNTVSGLEYVGSIVCDKTQEDYVWGGYNNIWVVYKGTVGGNIDDVEVYFPVKFSNVVTTNGEVSYDSDPYIEGYSEISDDGGWFGTYSKGYADASEMYESIITDNIVDYEYPYTASDEIEALK